MNTFSRQAILAGLAALLTALPATGAEPVSFRNQIAPILVQHCTACHGPKKAEGSYRADTYDKAMQEGDSTLAGFVAKNLEDSEAFRRITSDDKDERMPLEGDPLPAEQVALIKLWIEEGAKFDGPDPKASLSSIVPPPVYPDPPESYPKSLPITAMVFRADGQELFVGGYHEITVWNPADGKLLRRIKNVGQRTYALALAPDGKVLAVAGGSAGRLGEVRLFDPASGKLVRVLGSTSDVVFDVAFNAKGDQIAAAGADNAIRIFEVASGKLIKTIESHSDWVMDVAWNADSTKLASASRDKTVKVFDVKTGDLLITYNGHKNPVKGVSFHPDGANIYSSGADKKVQLWKIADGKKAADVGSFGGEVYKLTAQDGFLFAPSADKTVRQYELASKKQVRSYAGHKDWALIAAYHHGTTRLASGGFDGEVQIWNTTDGKPVVQFKALPGFVVAEEKK